MTRYGFDADRRIVVATWPAGVGHAATVSAEVPETVADETGRQLAAALERLSGVMWRTYTHPWVGELDGLDDPDGAAWTSADGVPTPEATDRGPFAEVLPALTAPNLPDGSGLLLVSYDPVVETAHQVGRLLHAGADPRLIDEIGADVAAEIEAVERAELGDLAGRARQAVALSRADASPVQICAAHTALGRDPLGSDELFTAIDPTAASVAAAHWLHAAAGLAAELSGGDPLGVVEEADDLEALPVLTPTLVLARMIEGGESAREVVLDLVREALDAAGGRIPDLEGLVLQIAEAEHRADDVAPDRRDEIRDAFLPDRVTPLDPSRPSIDLLEDLLAGIRGCWLIYQEYSDPGLDDVTVAGSVTTADPTVGADLDEAFDEARESVRAAFLERLRVRAEAGADRLL